MHETLAKLIGKWAAKQDLGVNTLSREVPGFKAGKSYRRGRLNIADLLVLTRLDLLLYKLKLLFTFLQKSYLNEEVSTEASTLVSIPWFKA